MNNLQSQLSNFLKTPKAQALIVKSIDIESHAARMKEILKSQISSLNSGVTGQNFLDYINVDDSVNIKQTGDRLELSVDINFDHEATHRDSLYPEGYPGGADLVYIFNNGYSARNHVYGTDRHGIFRVSRLTRPPMSFIQSAVSIFNSTSPAGIRAEYDGSYK